MTIYSSYSVHTNPQSATIHWLTSMLSRIWRYTTFDDAHYLQFKEFWHQLLETHLTGVRVSTRGGLIPWCHKIRLKPKALGFPISIISQKHLVFLLPFYPTFSALLQKSTVKGDACIKSSSSEEDREGQLWISCTNCHSWEKARRGQHSLGQRDQNPVTSPNWGCDNHSKCSPVEF